MQRSLLLFESAIKSKHTLRKYTCDLDQFLAFTATTDYDSLTKIPSDQIQTMLEDYLMDCKKRLHPNSVLSKFMGIKHFLVMNRITVNWDIIWKMCPEKVKTRTYRAWQSDELEKMLDTQDTLRNKAFVHFQASTGARIGVHDYDLTLSQLQEMPEKCKAVLMYAGTLDEYWAFLTPEASQSLDDYLDQRRNDGEYFDKKTPLFRTSYLMGIQKVAQLKSEGARALMNRIIEKSNVGREKIAGRYDVQADHGFRKRFNTILKLNNDVNSNIAEKILGHKNGLDGVYFTPTLEECFQDFFKAVPELVISEKERVKAENRKLQQEKSEIEKKNQELKLTKDELKKIKNNASNTEKENKINEDKVNSLQETVKQLAEGFEQQKSMIAEILQIRLQTNETIERESNPSNPHFPDGSPYDTRLVNLRSGTIDEKSMTVIDSEFEERVNVVLRKDKVYCTLDNSTTCKHVLFALGNAEFYNVVKKHNVAILISTTN